MSSYDRSHKRRRSETLNESEIKVYLSGKWDKVGEFENLRSIFVEDGYDVYDWSDAANRTCRLADQDQDISDFLCDSNAFILHYSDPDYSYSASRLQLGYMLLSGKPCIIYDTTPPDTNGEKFFPPMLDNLYENRLTTNSFHSNLFIADTLAQLKNILRAVCFNDRP